MRNCIDFFWPSKQFLFSIVSCLLIGYVVWELIVSAEETKPDKIMLGCRTIFLKKVLLHCSYSLILAHSCCYPAANPWHIKLHKWSGCTPGEAHRVDKHSNLIGQEIWLHTRAGILGVARRVGWSWRKGTILQHTQIEPWPSNWASRFGSFRFVSFLFVSFRFVSFSFRFFFVSRQEGS